MLKKRFASFALCIAMLLSMSATVFAAEPTQTHDPLADIPRAEIYRDVVSAFYEADGSQVQPRWTSGDSENNYGSHGLIALRLRGQRMNLAPECRYRQQRARDPG